LKIICLIGHQGCGEPVVHQQLTQTDYKKVREAEIAKNYFDMFAMVTCFNVGSLAMAGGNGKMLGLSILLPTLYAL